MNIQSWIKIAILATLLASSFYLGWFLSSAGHGTELLFQFEKGYHYGIRESTDLHAKSLGM